MGDKNYYLNYAKSVIKSNNEGIEGLLFASDIVIDENAFNTAADDFEKLLQNIDELKNKIADMLATLEKGIDTPAGRKFIRSCDSCLLTPIEQQKTAISHIAEDLRMSINRYRRVFESYQTLQAALKEIEENRP